MWRVSLGARRGIGGPGLCRCRDDVMSQPWSYARYSSYAGRNPAASSPIGSVLIPSRSPAAEPSHVPARFLLPSFTTLECLDPPEILTKHLSATSLLPLFVFSVLLCQSAHCDAFTAVKIKTTVLGELLPMNFMFHLYK